MTEVPRPTPEAGPSQPHGDMKLEASTDSADDRTERSSSPGDAGHADDRSCPDRPRGRAWVRWTPEEHATLEALVKKLGVARSWSLIASHIPGRTGKQCRERWLNHTTPDSKRGHWSSEEEYTLATHHSLVGSQWCRISRHLAGRNDNAVKNHWNATLRSKVMHKPQSILWLYVAELKAGKPGPAALEAALLKWENNVPAHQVVRTLGFWPSQRYSTAAADASGDGDGGEDWGPEAASDATPATNQPTAVGSQAAAPDQLQLQPLQQQLQPSQPRQHLQQSQLVPPMQQHHLQAHVQKQYQHVAHAASAPAALQHLPPMQLLEQDAVAAQLRPKLSRAALAAAAGPTTLLLSSGSDPAAGADAHALLGRQLIRHRSMDVAGGAGHGLARQHSLSRHQQAAVLAHALAAHGSAGSESSTAPPPATAGGIAQPFMVTALAPDNAPGSAAAAQPRHHLLQHVGALGGSITAQHGPQQLMQQMVYTIGRSGEVMLASAPQAPAPPPHPHPQLHQVLVDASGRVVARSPLPAGAAWPSALTLTGHHHGDAGPAASAPAILSGHVPSGAQPPSGMQYLLQQLPNGRMQLVPAPEQAVQFVQLAGDTSGHLNPPGVGGTVGGSQLAPHDPSSGSICYQLLAPQLEQGAPQHWPPPGPGATPRQMSF